MKDSQGLRRETEAERDYRNARAALQERPRCPLTLARYKAAVAALKPTGEDQ